MNNYCDPLAYYSPLFDQLRGTAAPDALNTLQTIIATHFTADRSGNLPHWQAVLNDLPTINPDSVMLNTDTIAIQGSCSHALRDRLRTSLMQLHPWRKGPFSLFDIAIDTEWRSDWKWQRIAPHLSNLKDKRVLDVGCGSGYHCWRIAGAGAQLVVGIDPTLLYVCQYQALQHFIRDSRVWVVPAALQDLPPRLAAFDTVFSMGVLYHRRSPLDHLLELKETLRPGGELVLETLVIDGVAGSSLVPTDRYAMMNNVWFIPSVPTLEQWLRKAGFRNIRTVDVTATTTQEQRTTDWMTFLSLADFLDPHDVRKTVEGYPAPLRATVLCNKPA